MYYVMTHLHGHSYSGLCVVGEGNPCQRRMTLPRACAPHFAIMRDVKLRHSRQLSLQQHVVRNAPVMKRISPVETSKEMPARMTRPPSSITRLKLVTFSTLRWPYSPSTLPDMVLSQLCKCAEMCVNPACLSRREI